MESNDDGIVSDYENVTELHLLKQQSRGALMKKCCEKM